MLRSFIIKGLRALAACVLASSSAGAADRIVRLQTPKPVSKDLDALPRIANPVDEAERRINAALAQLDARVRRSAANCRGDNGDRADWERSVQVPMHGPGFLSYVISDSTYCGGAHPSFAQTAVVYDLKTGKPVDWTALLPASLTGKVELMQTSDESRMVTVSSKRLYDLFLQIYDRERTDDPECKSAVRSAGDTGPPAMTVWLDGKQNGLAVHFDLAHAVQACADDVLVPAATLRAEGAGRALLDALAAAPRT